MSKLDDPREVERYAHQVAAKRGWKVNPDPTFVGPLWEGLAAQTARLGKPYCPCRDADGGEADRDIICPCAYAADDIRETGQCYCGLYLSLDKDERDVHSIPERR